jgi:hypothetical protein
MDLSFFFHFSLCWPQAGDILQPANKRFTNPSVIVSVTERCQAKDKTRLGAKKTERRHVPCDLNLSRRKRIWNGKKERTSKSTPKSKKKKNNMTREYQKIFKEKDVRHYLLPHLPRLLCVSSICQTPIQPHTSVSDRTRNSCFLPSRLAATHLSNAETQFCVFQILWSEFDRCVAPFVRVDSFRLKMSQKHDVSSCDSLSLFRVNVMKDCAVLHSLSCWALVFSYFPISIAVLIC